MKITVWRVILFTLLCAFYGAGMGYTLEVLSSKTEYWWVGIIFAVILVWLMIKLTPLIFKQKTNKHSQLKQTNNES